jgi:hypothetical protein
MTQQLRAFKYSKAGLLLCTCGARASAGRPGARPRLRTTFTLAPEFGRALLGEAPGRTTKDT